MSDESSVFGSTPFGVSSFGQFSTLSTVDSPNEEFVNPDWKIIEKQVSGEEYGS